MKQHFKYILLSFLFICCIGFRANAQSIHADARLEQQTIRIGDQTKLYLTVYRRGNGQVNFPKLADTLTGKVLIVGTPKTDTLLDKKNHLIDTITQTYTITSFDPGTYTIPSFSVGVGKDVLKTNEITLEVVSVKVDTTKGIYDIKQPIAVSYNLWDWLKDNWIWILSVVVALGLIVALILYLRKRPKKAPTLVKQQPVTPIHQVILQKLEELRARKVWQNNGVKDYYSELSDLLREYLEKRFDVKAHEKTTAEILQNLRTRSIAEENRDAVQQLLFLADLVKFAKEKPLPEVNEKSMDDAVNFVLKTQKPDQAETAEGGGAV
jgi:hypothetical protein